MYLAIVYNTRSGSKKQKLTKEFFTEKFSSINHELFFWNEKNPIEDIEKLILIKKFTHVVAAGGDGTVNRIGMFVSKHDLTLGIIPLGSGNGFARSLNISIQPTEAVNQIVNGTSKKIDSAYINDKKFFCTAGLGFDAHIGKLFSTNTKRGFWSYFKITLKELLFYRPASYQIATENKKFETKAFLITVCNAGQWGNDIYIDYGAQVNDGILSLVIVKPFPVYAIPRLALLLFQKKIQRSRYVETYRGRNFSVSATEKMTTHFDGEPNEELTKVTFRVNAADLNVLC